MKTKNTIFSVLCLLHFTSANASQEFGQFNKSSSVSSIDVITTQMTELSITKEKKQKEIEKKHIFRAINKKYIKQQDEEEILRTYPTIQKLLNRINRCTSYANTNNINKQSEDDLVKILNEAGFIGIQPLYKPQSSNEYKSSFYHHHWIHKDHHWVVRPHYDSKVRGEYVLTISYNTSDLYSKFNEHKNDNISDIALSEFLSDKSTELFKIVLEGQNQGELIPAYHYMHGFWNVPSYKQTQLMKDAHHSLVQYGDTNKWGKLHINKIFFSTFL